LISKRVSSSESKGKIQPPKVYTHASVWLFIIDFIIDDYDIDCNMYALLLILERVSFSESKEKIQPPKVYTHTNLYDST
jgi:hypothetical protein